MGLSTPKRQEPALPRGGAQCPGLTCSAARAPGRELAGRSEAVEHADVLWRKELRELCVAKGVALAVEYGRGLVGDVQDLPSDQGHSHSKHVLQRKDGTPVTMARQDRTFGQTGGCQTRGSWLGRPGGVSGPQPWPAQLCFPVPQGHHDIWSTAIPHRSSPRWPGTLAAPGIALAWTRSSGARLG